MHFLPYVWTVKSNRLVNSKSMTGVCIIARLLSLQFTIGCVEPCSRDKISYAKKYFIIYFLAEWWSCHTKAAAGKRIKSKNQNRAFLLLF